MGEMILTTDDGRGDRIGNRMIAIEVIGNDRLLKPGNPVFIEPAANLDRLVGGPALVDVDHDLNLVAKCRAHVAHIGDILVMREQMCHLHLDRVIPLPDEALRLFDHAVMAEATKAT